MGKTIVCGTVLTLLLIGMLTLTFNIQLVKASGSIWIRSDGSVDPDTAPISTVDNVTYTFTDDIYSGIAVERSNIIIDGNGYTLQGSGSGTGFFLRNVNNMTIQKTKIKGFAFGIELLDFSSNNIISGNNITQNNVCGIWLDRSSYNMISGNSIADNGYGILLLWHSLYNSIVGNNITQNNGYGIWLDGCDFNTVSGNSITSNGYGIGLFYYSCYNTVSGNSITSNVCGIWLFGCDFNTVSGNSVASNVCGIWLEHSFNNTIYHNNFVDNTKQVYSDDSTNVWDDGYPSGGNYWSDYAGVDLYSGSNQDQPGSDGIGDTEHVIDPMNQDRYPLMYLWGVRDVAITSVTVSATEVFQGDLVNITVAGTNEGGQTETFTVTSYANLTVIGEQTVTDLAPAAEITFTFSWNTTEVDVGSYIIKAEASVVEDETDTADNAYVDGTVEVMLRYPPVAVITAPTEGYVFEEIAFSGADSYDPDGGVIVWWLWDFGDETISAEQNPTHTYTLAGTYEVTLVVTDDEDQVSDPVAHIIWIKSPQEAIQELIETIKSWDLPEGTESSLTSKLDEVILLLDMENENGAIHKLMDFINQVEALRGMKLTIEQADYLTAEAQKIIDLIKE